MSQTKISAMTDATDVEDNAVIPLVQNGQNEKATPAILRNQMRGLRYFPENGFEVFASNNGVTLTKSAGDFTVNIPNKVELHKVSIQAEDSDLSSNEILIKFNYNWNNLSNLNVASMSLPIIAVWQLLNESPVNNEFEYDELSPLDVSRKIVEVSSNRITIKLIFNIPVSKWGVSVSL